MSASDTAKIKEGLEPFSSIPFGTLGQVSLLRRYDTKYVCSVEEALALLSRVGGCYSVASQEGRLISSYRTLYFDTPDLRCFHDHRRGRRSRYKFRFREYVDRKKTFFEVKEKTNRGETRKLRLERSVEADERLSHEEAEALERNSPFQASEFQAHLSTCFRRFTLVDPSRKERVTFDHDLEFLLERESRSLPGLVIIEVKQMRPDRNSPIVGALRSMRIQSMQFSKYCAGNVMFAVERSAGFYKENMRKVMGAANG